MISIEIVGPSDLGHAHFQGKLFVCLLGIPHTKPCTKFEVCSSRSFEDMFDHAKIIGLTWPRPRHAHFQGKLFVPCSACPIQSRIPNLKSLAQVVLEICSIICQKCRGHVREPIYSLVTWPRPRTRPLYGKLFVHLLGIPHTKLRTTFEVSSSSNFTRYCALSVLESRVWPFKVTWRHLSRDHSIAHMPFPIGGPLEPNLYL